MIIPAASPRQAVAYVDFEERKVVFKHPTVPDWYFSFTELEGGAPYTQRSPWWTENVATASVWEWLPDN